jgi:hypothetical protein
LNVATIAPCCFVRIVGKLDTIQTRLIVVQIARHPTEVAR